LFYGGEEMIPPEVQRYIGNTFQNISYLPLGKIDFPWNSLEMTELLTNIRLPSNRNPEKDTITHLWNMHVKAACLKYAVDFYLPNPYAFVWIDFEVSAICSTAEKPVQTFLHELSTRDYLPFLEHSQDQMIIPGCWSKVGKSDLTDYPEKMDCFLNNIYWRFCGGVLWGSATAVRNFWNLYVKHFRNFLETHQVLTWEVNFWAWLEAMEENWNPVWYSGDHNDSMFQLPGRFIAHRLGERYIDKCYYKENLVREIQISKIDYPKIPNYYPMSASYLSFFEKEKDQDQWREIGLLNTRFVNYHVEPCGAYWWPSEEGKVIRTKNMFSEWDSREKKVKGFTLMKNPEYIPNKEPGFSEGIEDIRLFSCLDGIAKIDILGPQEKYPYFIGSTYNYAPSNKIRMVIGKYDYKEGKLSDMKVIEPPTDTYCEKNWIPIFTKTQRRLNLQNVIPVEKEVYFIYKWFPMQIGRLRETDSLEKYTLEIEIEHFTSPMIFQKIRGSTCFIEDKIEGVEGLLGVVHYSEDNSPTRQYFHRLVLLDSNNFKPLKYSDCFYFEKIGVEFCIGFTKKDLNYVFWISKLDRDAYFLSFPKFSFPRWNTCGRWGV
jgi:hypothetical protein